MPTRPGRVPCRHAGIGGPSPTDASAQLVTGAQYEAIQQKARAKYGGMVPMSKVLNAIGATVKGKRNPYGDRGVVITPAG